MARQGDFTQICVLVVLLLALSSVCSFRNCVGELHEFFYQFTLGLDKGFWVHSSHYQSHQRLNDTYECQFLNL